MNSARLFRAGLVTAVGLSAGTAQAWVSKDIRDWRVECTNGLTCEMGFTDWEAKGVQSVGFQRGGAPNAPVRLKLRVAPDLSPGSRPEAAYRFLVDGKEVLVLNAGDLQPDEYGSSFLHADQAKVLALMDAMETGSAMEIAVDGGKDTRTSPVKLSGVKAAMLYIDEVQDRLGRTDALEARGDRTPPADAMARDIGSLDDLPEIVRKDFTDSGGACADMEPGTIGRFDGFDIASDDVRLIVVPCGVGGAYNQPYAIYVGYDVIVERISFPLMVDGRPTTTSTAYNIGFDPKTKEMTSFFKGRGIGDCGQFYKWRFNDGQFRLELLEERAKDECDEKEGGPETFPIVWRAKP